MPGQLMGPDMERRTLDRLARLESRILDAYCAAFPTACWVDADQALAALGRLGAEVQELEDQLAQAHRETERAERAAESAEERLAAVGELLGAVQKLDQAGKLLAEAQDIVRQAKGEP